jgi:phosphoglycerol transferase MdoB-like AlkP superfamily enzyme
MLSIVIVMAAGLVACYICAACGVGSRRVVPAKPPISNWIWSFCFFALLIFLGIYDRLSLINAIFPQELCCAVALGIGAYVSLRNAHIRAKLGSLHRPLPQILEFGLLLVGAYLTFIAIELPSNPYMTDFYWEGLRLEVVIIFIMMLALHFLFQRSGVGAAIAALAFEIAGIAEYFVVTFRDAPIMASDVLALGTAAAVGGGYTYILNGSVLLSLALLAATVLLLSLTPLVTKGGHRARCVVVNLVVGAAIIAGSVVGFKYVSFANDLGIWYNAWIPLDSYWREGFVSSFLTQVQSFSPKEPEGYSNEKAEDLLSSYAATYDATLGSTEERKAAETQYNEIKPTVVFVMNESFSDLSIYDDLAGSYTGPNWFNSFDGALSKGTLYVSPFGGGTCNSEWEFLTGCSMAYMGSGVYPYMVYDMTGVENLAADLKQEGYDTLAMHPNLASNWYRNVVYPTFGFDTFLDISDFTGASKLRNMVTDEATYDKIYEELTSTDDSQFILDVTMQNHGGYDTGALPASMMKDYDVDGYDNSELNEYLALIDESDRALESFVEKLSTLDKPVVLVFFGDHQPSIASFYNDWLTPDDNGLVHQERAHTTSYMIYANYDVAGATTGNVEISSTNYLAADLAQLIGMPLTDYQKAELVMQTTDVPAINALGYQDADGTWHDISEAGSSSTGAAKLASDLQTLQYYQLFSDGVHYQTGSGYSGDVWGRLD